MISDLDTYRAASVLIRQHGDDAGEADPSITRESIEETAARKVERQKALEQGLD